MLFRWVFLLIQQNQRISREIVYQILLVSSINSKPKVSNTINREIVLMEKRNSFMSSYQAINDTKLKNNLDDSSQLLKCITSVSSLISSLSTSMDSWEKLNNDILSSWDLSNVETDEIEIDLDKTITTIKSKQK